MKSLIVYDSQYGNTEKIAQTLAKSLPAKIVRVTKVKDSDLKNIDLLILGSPTQGGRATHAMQNFLVSIPPNGIKGLKVAVFDTRVPEKDLKFALKILMKIIGYAAPKMAGVITSIGGRLIAPPEGFIVKGKEGPLATGELERAKMWIKSNTTK